VRGDGEFTRQLHIGSKPGPAPPALCRAVEVRLQLPQQLVGGLLTAEPLLNVARALVQPGTVEQQHAVAAVQHAPHHRGRLRMGFFRHASPSQ